MRFMPDEPDETAAEEEDFARMLEESLQPTFLHEGEPVEGKIVALGSDVAFVDVGGKGEATIDLAELADPDAGVEVQVGDTVKAIVVSTTGGIKLSHKLAKSAATREALNGAFQSGLPVEGRVEKAIKGGFEIRFSGQRAFCPISQIDTRFTEDPSVHEGKSYTFRVIEFKQEGKNIVVSRRAILEEEERERAEEVRQLIVPDAVLLGRVVSVREYGAFVDLGGGVQGLLHISEMGWSRVSDPTSVVQPGDEISVKVLRVDEEKGRISLGLKQLQADPWGECGHRLSSRSGAERSRHPRCRFRRVRGASAGDRSPGARLHIPTDWQDRRMEVIGFARHRGRGRDPEHRPRAQTNGHRDRRRRLGEGERSEG